MSKLINRCKAILFNLGAAMRQRRQLPNYFLQESERKNIHPNQESQQDSKIEFPIPDDLLFKILILLPAASLFTMQFVCKKWFYLINTSIFIRCHAQKSETLLICKCATYLKPSDDEKYAPKHFFRFLDLAEGVNTFVDSSIINPLTIKASYDGLILATTGNSNSNSLIVVNPVTRKHVMLPLSIEHHVFIQSFGIAFSNKAKTYKVAHLFEEKSGAMGCSVMNIRTRSWTSMEVPSDELTPDLRQDAVSVDGSLYWFSWIEGCDFLVSLSLEDEKFASKDLPVRRALMDRLLEIGGYLGLATGAQPQLVMQVWILVTDGGFGENWIKKYSIDVSGFEMFPRPVYCSRDGERIVVEKGNDMYVCNCETGEMKVIHSSVDGMWHLRKNRNHIPHHNTLVSLDHLL